VDRVDVRVPSGKSPFTINPAFLKACADLNRAFVDAAPVVCAAFLAEVGKLIRNADAIRSAPQ
jgi:hypothetical protein